MRLTILAALLLSSLALPAWADDNEAKGQMVVLKANQIGQIFCLSRLGNDPEHVNHYGKASFAKLVGSRFDVLRVETSYPWLLALAAPR